MGEAVLSKARCLVWTWTLSNMSNETTLSELQGSHLEDISDSVATLFTNETVPEPNPITSRNVIMNMEGIEVFSCQDAELYFIIPPSQNVATQRITSRITTLRIIVLNTSESSPSPPAYIDADQWFYPLIPFQSPIFRTAQGHYLFPDVTSNAPGAAVGIVLPSSILEEQRFTFESLLLSLSGLQCFPSELETSTSNLTNVPNDNASLESTQHIDGTPIADLVTKIADGMMAAAEVASRGISASATMTVQLLNKGTDYVKSQFPQTTDPTVIHPDVKQTVGIMQDYTGIAVELSGIVVSKVAEATTNLATFIAYYVQSSANKTIAELSGQSEAESGQVIDNVLQVTGSAMKGISMVYSDLLQAGKFMGAAIASNTVQVVGHCYGHDAGEIVDTAASTVGNITTLGLNSATIDPEQMVHRATVKTGKSLLVKNNTPGNFQSTFPL